MRELDFAKQKTEGDKRTTPPSRLCRVTTPDKWRQDYDASFNCCSETDCAVSSIVSANIP